MKTTGPVQTDGALSGAAIILLHAVSGVDTELLRKVRIRPSHTNWLRAPWYPYHRGGAITVGRTIWFTCIWFDPEGYGDGSPASCIKWLLHLAHEVGHLPQAEHYGRDLPGKIRYVSAFALQYVARAALFKRDVHDTRLEREADKGRAVLSGLLADPLDRDSLAAAILQDDGSAVLAWCEQRQQAIANSRNAYSARLLA